MRKAVIAGHTCLDITPVFHNKRVSEIQALLKPGKLINVQGAKVYTGGVVANTGLAMKQMGIDTCLIGKIGKDSFGQMVYANFKEHGAEHDLIVDGSVSTSYTMVLAVPGIDRIFLHNPGANDCFGWDDIEETKLEGADLFHFGYPPLMKRTYDNQGAELVRMFREISKKGIITSLDMAAVEAKSPAGQADWKAILKQVLPYIDFFMPSIEELYYMIDPQKYQILNEKAGQRDITELLSIEDDIKPLAEKAVQLGAKNMLLKCGAPGLYYRMGGRTELAQAERRLGLDMSTWYQREGFEASYKPEKVCSGTGAGDTTIAAFLTALLQAYPLDTCLQAAAATGAGCVECYDALGGILPIEAQMERIKNGLEKQYLL